MGPVELPFGGKINGFIGGAQRKCRRKHRALRDPRTFQQSGSEKEHPKMPLPLSIHAEGTFALQVQLIVTVQVRRADVPVRNGH